MADVPALVPRKGNGDGRKGSKWEKRGYAGEVEGSNERMDGRMEGEKDTVGEKKRRNIHTYIHSQALNLLTLISV